MLLCSQNKKGAILPLVLGILLAISIMLSSLLQMPNVVQKISNRYVNELQLVYNAESAIIAHLAGLPKDFFKDAPWNENLSQVNVKEYGPWSEFSAKCGYNRVRVLAGIADSSRLILRSPSVRAEIFDGFSGSIKKSLSENQNLQTKFGNRRVFGNAKDFALRIIGGDLSLDLDYSAKSGKFIVDGAFEIRGSAIFDTLIVYAKGPITLKGNINVKNLWALSEESLYFLQNVKFSGAAVARYGIIFKDNAKGNFPAFAMALYAGENLNTYELTDSKFLPDTLLLPNFVAGEFFTFEWSLK